MKIRNIVLLTAASLASALLLAGCGSDKDSKSEKKEAKVSKEVAADYENKAKAVDKAESEFKKSKDDINACRNLAMAYISKASPASPKDPKKVPELPKDRDKSLKAASKTLETCVDIDSKDRSVQTMLASSYMAQSDYDKAAPLLEKLATSAKGQERANAFYAWGLAESNAQDYAAAIRAWNGFISAAPKNDPRIAQVRQSIKSLKAALKQPKPDASKDSGKGSEATTATTSDDGK